MQSGAWVLGIEGQGNWADFKGSNPSTAFAGITNQSRVPLSNVERANIATLIRAERIKSCRN